MLQLQKPKWIYMGGRLRPWEEGVLHISCEAVTRGLNVYEGLKGYWSDDNSQFGLVALPRHFARLLRSAKLLHIPCPVNYPQFESACHELVKSLYTTEKDMWIRATLYVIEGHWGENTVADLVLTAYHQPRTRPEPINIGVSTWQRSSDVSLPPRIKTSPNYEVARLARIEGRKNGYPDMILLNQWGRVAEATGAGLLMVRNGQVITTPPSEGRLESITVEIVSQICRSRGIDYIERPIDRTELYIADELCLAGTLAELVAIKRVDEYELPHDSPILSGVQDCFFEAVRGVHPHPAVDLSIV
ncbi:aminotransferase class IV [candidate division KSB1 bacterium]|nr:aminotransferase class IV [candidate division KSB1 bacterium]